MTGFVPWMEDFDCWYAFIYVSDYDKNFKFGIAKILLEDLTNINL